MIIDQLRRRFSTAPPLAKVASSSILLYQFRPEASCPFKVFDSEIFWFQESIPHCCFRFFFILVFLDRRNLISPWMQGIKVVESILLIIWRFFCKKKKNWRYISIALIEIWVCFACEISHSSLLSRDMHLSHELSKTWIVYNKCAQFSWMMKFTLTVCFAQILYWNKITITLTITLI